MGSIHRALHEVNTAWYLKYVISDLDSTVKTVILAILAINIDHFNCMLGSGVCLIHMGGQNEEQNASGFHFYYSDGHSLGQCLIWTLFWNTQMWCYKSQIQRARGTENKKNLKVLISQIKYTEDYIHAWFCDFQHLPFVISAISRTWT